MSRFRSDVAIAACLVLLTTAAFYQVAGHDFVRIDDNDYVTDNAMVRRGLSREGIVWAFTTGRSANWHPLTWLSHLADCTIYGLDARGHHLTNLALHVANTVLLFVVLRRMTAGEDSLWPSAVVAALFGVHPLHVESVAWVAERKDVLSTLFWMLTMWAYAWYAARPGVTRYVAVAVLLALGLMCKPMLVTLPFVLLLLDYWPLGRTMERGADTPSTYPIPLGERKGFAGRHRTVGLAVEKLPLFALSAASCVVTFLVQRQGGAVQALDVSPLWQRLANALISYGTYLRRTVWPSDLAFFYPVPREAIVAKGFLYPPVAFGFVLIVSVTVAVCWLARRHRYLPVGWFWYLGTLVPVIGLVQVGDQALADRYTYVPLVGIFIMVAWGAWELAGPRRVPRAVATAVAAAAILACTLLTWKQVGYWCDTGALAERALAVTVNNPLATYLDGVAHLARRDLDGAMQRFEQTLELKPGDLTARFDLATLLMEDGQLDRAARHYLACTKIKPESAVGYAGLGAVLARQGNLDAAAAQLGRAIELDGDRAEYRVNMAMILVRLQRWDEAAGHIRSAVMSEPERLGAERTLGDVLVHEGKLDEAFRAYSAALRIDPRDAGAHAGLGSLLLAQRRPLEAITHWRQAIELDPALMAVANNLAWVLATNRAADVRNGREAVELAKRVCEATRFQDPASLDTLAAAYAEVGQFDSAVKTAAQAADLSVAVGNPLLADQIRKRLELYQAGRTHRE